MSFLPARRPARWALWALIAFVLLLAALLVAPSTALVDIKHDGNGWSVHTRPLTDIMQRGVFNVRADFSTQSFDIDRLRADSAYCPTRIGHGYGPISLDRHYSWGSPADDQATREERMAHCQTLRTQLRDIPGTLSAALLQGDPDTVRDHLGHSMVSHDSLPLLLPEVGEPTRTRLAQLMLVSPDTEVPVHRLDVALVVADKDHVRRWMPDDGPNGTRRYALYGLGMTKLVKRYASDSGSFFSRRFGGRNTPPPVDGFKQTDYYVANAHCDAEYAAFLADKGIPANDLVILQAFLARIRHETPSADIRMRYLLRRVPTRAVDATPAQCAALVRQYRDVELPTGTLDKLSDLTATQMMTRYHQLVREEKAGRHFATREQEDRFYQQLQYNQETSPLPSLPRMFTSLLQGQPSAPALCAALDAIPWLGSHPQALDEFMNLADSWKSKPIEDIAYLENPRQCNPALLMPPSLFPTETKQRNTFLQHANVRCHMVTPDRKYVYAQKLECDHDD